MNTWPGTHLSRRHRDETVVERKMAFRIVEARPHYCGALLRRLRLEHARSFAEIAIFAMFAPLMSSFARTEYLDGLERRRRGRASP